MSDGNSSAEVMIKDGKLINGRVSVKIFSNLEQGELQTVHAIVLHQTGGRDAQSTLDGYKSSSIGAHFLIDRDGAIYQTARITQKAFHVGKIRSKCLDLKSCEPEDCGFRGM
jgi:N-acetyl-anhydromuramyl-L-alanine amidase AmpD